MQYLGGKSRIAKQIAAVILESTDERSYYIEPFVGAGSVAAQLVPHFDHAYLSDVSPDLIALWRALQEGWQPPMEVSEELYRSLRNAPVSALRGFVGYGCSFGGKWFGGYARANNANPKGYAIHASNMLNRKIGLIGMAEFSCLDYQDAPYPSGSVVYCDPPYRGTTTYKGVTDFDSEHFWKWAEYESQYSAVFVSEYAAPEGWESIWNAAPRMSLRKDDNSSRASERLWVHHAV